MTVNRYGHVFNHAIVTQIGKFFATPDVSSAGQNLRAPSSAINFPFAQYLARFERRHIFVSYFFGSTL
jgi:hypothetical protein